MSKVTIDSLPAFVSADETLARNKALWPVATHDAKDDKEDGDSDKPETAKDKR